jgi:hypothetical protein
MERATRDHRELVRLTEERLGGDLLRTVGRRLELELVEEHDGVVVNITVDGEEEGGLGVGFIGDLEQSIAFFADSLCEHTLHEAVWGGWPICSRHGGHPLEPVAVGGIASWCCPRDQSVVAAIGQLPATNP